MFLQSIVGGRGNLEMLLGVDLFVKGSKLLCLVDYFDRFGF